MKSIDFAGFSTNNPWLPIADDFRDINVEKEKNDSNSFLNFYKSLIELRKENLPLSLGKYKPINSMNENCFAFHRIFERNHCIIALNFSNSEQNLELDNIKDKNIILSTNQVRNKKIDKNDIKLYPNEGIIIK